MVRYRAPSAVPSTGRSITERSNRTTTMHRRGTAAVLEDLRQGTDHLDMHDDDKDKLLMAMGELVKALRTCDFGDDTDPNMLQVQYRPSFVFINA